MIWTKTENMNIYYDICQLNSFKHKLSVLSGNLYTVSIFMKAPTQPPT